MGTAIFFILCITAHAVLSDSSSSSSSSSEEDGVTWNTNNRPKILIDNDAGGDDAMAIFIALLYEKYYQGPEVVALTTGNGNTGEENVSRNNQRILQVADRQDMPIYRGSKSSLVITPAIEAHHYGEDGLGDNQEVFKNLKPPQEDGAVQTLIELSKRYEGNLTVVTIGTVTNVALAMLLDPGFVDRLQQLYVAAGHIESDINPEPEFNARMDPEAYHLVMTRANPDKVTIIPFSQTRIHLNFTQKWRKEVLGGLDTRIIREQNKYERVSMPKIPGWMSLDPSAVSAVLKPELVDEYQYAQNDIVLCGPRRGMNTHEYVDKEKANVRVVEKINKDKYAAFLLDVFSHDY